MSPIDRQPASPSPDHSPAWFTTMVLGGLALFFIPVMALAAVAVLRDNGSGGVSVEAVPSTVVDVSLNEFSFSGPGEVPAGEVTLRITNTGSAEHDLGVRELGVISPVIAPGATVELPLGVLAAGTYEIYCSIPGHESAGMVSTFTVVDSTVESTEAAASPDSHHGHGHGHGEEMEYAAMDQAMMESMLAFPAETEGRGNPVLEPTEILADGTKVFDLTAEIVDWEVEPGRFVEAWTYNGVVPAPQILLDRGDKVQVRVRVRNDLPLGHDIHWHGVRTPNNQDGVAPYTQELIAPNGGTHTYEFTAETDAIGMYHAHAHGQMKVVRGMFGVIRIGDNPVPRGVTVSGVTIPEDLELAADIPMVLNDAGTIGYSLNGKSFPATEPLVLDQGDWASVTYYNEGLQVHPMHLHQFPQLVYAKDGVPLDHPYWADTINVTPGERYTVLFRADEPGTWVWHCHILTHVESHDGMFGMVTAVVVNEVPDFDPDVDAVRPHDFRLTPAATADGEG